MNTQEVIEKAERLRDLNAQIKAADETVKELKAEARECEVFLAEEFAQNMITSEVNFDGLRVSAGYETKYSVFGGDVENPEKKTPLVDLLIDSGFLDSEKVRKITDGRAVNASTLQAAIRKAAKDAPGVIERLKADELLKDALVPFAKVK